MPQRSLAVLLEIYPRGVATPYRYQNYRYTAPIVYEGELFTYLAFGVRNAPLVDLSLSSGDTTIEMQNSAALDTILRSQNDLQRAVVLMRFIDPTSVHAPSGARLSVSHITREGGYVIFTMRSPTNALQGSFTSKYFGSADFPELPVYKPRL